MSLVSAYSNILAGVKNTLTHSPAAAVGIASLVCNHILAAFVRYLHC